MRRARHERTAALEPSPRLSVSHSIAEPAAPAATEVLLLPAGTFLNEVGPEVDECSQRNRHLAVAIRQRIETRLASRIRDLAVRIVGQTVVLEGKCSTYYTKQLAQHAALGILDDEHLENAIIVEVRR